MVAEVTKPVYCHRCGRTHCTETAREMCRLRRTFYPRVKRRTHEEVVLEKRKKQEADPT